jgi:hypothetical protein
MHIHLPAQYAQIPVAVAMENSITHTVKTLTLKIRRRGRYETNTTGEKNPSEERKKRKSEEFNELSSLAVYLCSLVIAYLP